MEQGLLPAKGCGRRECLPHSLSARELPSARSSKQRFFRPRRASDIRGGLKLQIVHQAAAAGFVQLFGPLRPLDDQQAAKRIPVRLEAGQQLPQRPNRPNHQGVVPRVFEQFLRPERKDRPREAEVVDHAFDRACFFPNTVAKRELQIGPHDGEHHPRHAAAGAHVEHFLALSQMGGELQRIDDIAADEFLVIGVPGQIELGVPVPEQTAVFVEQFKLLPGAGDGMTDKRSGQRVVTGAVRVVGVSCHPGIVRELATVGRVASFGKPSRPWPNEQLSGKRRPRFTAIDSSPMKNFLRVVQATLRRRFTFLAAVACSIGVALFWGGNLALIKPVIEITFTDEKRRTLADQKVADANEKLAAIDKELAKANAELAAAPEGKRRELGLRQKRLEQQRDLEQKRLELAEFLRPLVQRYVPNNPFAALGLFLGFFVVATLLKDAMLVGNLVLVERLTQLAMFDMRNDLFRKTLKMEMAHFGEGHSSHIMHRITSDVTCAFNGVNVLCGRMILEPLKMLACLIGAAYICWKLCSFRCWSRRWRRTSWSA